jgi:L-threonine-O-3-phosphate decarboxylase
VIPVSNRPVHGGNLAWAAALAHCSPSAILDFSASINPLGLPPSAIAAIQSHLAYLRDYPDPSYRSLRAALGQFHQISPDFILPGNGAAELLTWASRELAELDFTHLITPAFSDYRRSLAAFSAQVVDCPLHCEDGKIWQLPALLDSVPGKVGLLLNNPHNPTGTLFSRSLILEALQRYALVVVDEAFMDFLPADRQQSAIDWVQEFPHLVVVRSLTKFYSLPGLRLGYAIAHPDRLQRWQTWRDPWSVNSLAAAVGEVVVQDTEFQRQTFEWLATAKPALFDGLNQLVGLHPYPSAANFFLVGCDRSVTELQTQLLQQHQILIRDCLSFAELGDRSFRVAVRSNSENQRLLHALAEAAEAPRSPAGEGRDEWARGDDSIPESNSKRSVEQRRGG